MKSSAVIAILQLPDSTLRRYAQLYAPYLSPGAGGGGGKHREYTDHDVRVLKLVIDMQKAKQSDEDIEVTLSSLRAGGWERLPPLEAGASAIIPSPAAMIEAHAERAVMQKEIEMLREQIALMREDHRQTLDAERSERADRDDLVRRLAESETLLRLYESGRLKPPT